MAKLKLVIDKLEDVDEKYRELYVKRADGKFLLDSDAEDVAGLKSALEKERSKIGDLEKQMAKYKDMDPEKYAELLEEHTKLKEKKLIDEGKLEEVVAERVGRMNDDWKKKETTWTTEKGSLHSTIYNLTVENEVMAAAVKVGAQEHAIPDIKRRAHDVFKVNEKGEIVALDDKGKPIYGKEGKALTPTEWMSELPTQAPHLFRGNSGGGANNGGGGGGGNTQLYRSEMNTKQKTDYIAKHGSEKYQDLPATRPK